MTARCELKVAVLRRCVIPSMEGRSRDRPMSTFQPGIGA